MVVRLFIVALTLSVSVPHALLAAGDGVVVIDPGHGGFEGGLRMGHRSEKDVALDIAREIERLLREGQVRAALTRKGDQSIGLKDRAAYANRLGPGVFLSVHLTKADMFNVYVDSYAEREGDVPLKDYYSVQSRQRHFLYESGALAGAVETAIRNAYGRDVRHGEMSLPVLDYIGAPAVLVEAPFNALSGGDYRADVARAAAAIVSGILDYGNRR